MDRRRAVAGAGTRSHRDLGALCRHHWWALRPGVELMPRQEQGIEYYLTSGEEKRYRVRWEEDGKHRSRSFRRLAGDNGARAFYRQRRETQEPGERVGDAGGQELTLAIFVADVWAPKARRRLAPTTWKRDTTVYNNHILHQLGGRPIGKLG